ncbi:SDR family NAD(P)-dependent oxidoreductase [Cryptosporangium aurantiacum]|uniref:Short-chain dehydrogenase n=1 Tax=Cryptosporangium aurantiacum TaxID=134849 RepID=A0A1M7R1B5_9ACTN|nr:SDR family NAD(P)-dependent oxidoreductase [Cryptosporangium aurantiacum]SHN38422.1 Short-chain dehydrogenase [Cryptosporangium aurantiacum]
MTDLTTKYGSWVLVAGASAGLGAAFAESAAKRGLNLVLAARRATVLEERAREFGARYGVRTRVVPVDLGDEDAADRLLVATDDLDLGIVIYNAAAEPAGLFLDADREDLRTNLAVNCWTPTLLAQGLGRRFRDRRRGALALVSSMAAQQGIARFAAYGAAKSYELILAESLWDEWREFGVDALAYIVGATASTGFRGAAPGAYRDNPDLSEGASRILVPASPEDVAERLYDRFHLGPRQYSHDADEEKTRADATKSRADVVTAMGLVTAGLARFHPGASRLSR